MNKQLGVVMHLKIRQAFRLLSLACGILFACYLAAFVVRFEIFSLPVRNNDHGWLGPVIRGNSPIVCIGDFYYYEGTDISRYRTFRPLCTVWLWVIHGILR